MFSTTCNCECCNYVYGNNNNLIMDPNLYEQNMFDHKTLSMPDDFMSPIFTNDNVVFNQAHYESSNEQYKPENDHDSQHATTIVQNMLFDTDNIELPASMMNLMDDFQNIPTPQSFSNLFETAFPSSYSEGFFLKKK
ncbi:unnamed protein product [Rotaria sp. Silwood1]|nr:unnamed protein product [Rotaria sp. Silwood1]